MIECRCKKKGIVEVQKGIEWNKAYDSFGGKAKQMMRGESRYGRCKTRSLDKEPVRNGKENVRMLMLVCIGIQCVLLFYRECECVRPRASNAEMVLMVHGCL